MAVRRQDQRVSQRWLLEHGVLGGRIDGRPITVLLNLNNEKKSRVDDQKAEASRFNKKLKFLS